jgi:phosphoribosylanthranilate isomerase
VAEIKFCGVTRAEDALRAAALGAAYVGVIFADSPRRVDVAKAKTILEPLKSKSVRRVGVFGPISVEDALQIGREASLDVLQLADESSASMCAVLRQMFDGALWPVVHGPREGRSLVATVLDYFRDGADAVVLDSRIEGQLGGTGITLDWPAIAHDVRSLRSHGRVVLAGGLRPENVAEAVRVVGPDVVDVSSGVESAVGIKDPERMRAFALAVRAHEVR